MGEVFQARDTKLDRDVFSRVGAPTLVIHCRGGGRNRSFYLLTPSRSMLRRGC